MTVLCFLTLPLTLMKRGSSEHLCCNSLGHRPLLPLVHRSAFQPHNASRVQMTNCRPPRKTCSPTTEIMFCDSLLGDIQYPCGGPNTGNQIPRVSLVLSACRSLFFLFFCNLSRDDVYKTRAWSTGHVTIYFVNTELIPELN